ncbi:hypothetical protein OTU49_010468 [Cherax quadricarinatus]|uniref:Uncharacterized protein n=1 Tax=Cherax quadricarinatus TaxID=27406 RepID=A0AAW0W8D3_CHEQU
MDFLSKTMIVGRSKPSRIIHVKPYTGSLSDDDGEMANFAVREAPLLSNTLTKEQPIRSRSLEHLTGDKNSAEMALKRLESLERQQRQSLGSPELAPVFTVPSANTFTVKTNIVNSNMDFNSSPSPVKRRINW